jgi:putative endonuclease
MFFYVYLICTINSKGNLISYVGYTNNVKKRLSFHNQGKGAKFTRGRRWKLLYKKRFLTKKKQCNLNMCLKKIELKEIKLNLDSKNETIKNFTCN